MSVTRPLPIPDRAESVFTYAAPTLVYGSGAINDVPHALRGHDRVLIITDAGVAATGAPERVAESLRVAGHEVHVFADSHVEPTDASLRQAINAARDRGPWDAFVAVGGGSSIDTAKAVNLLTTNPGALLDYVNAPIGGGQAPTQPLKPLVAVPTTTGTGSESTTICVLDVLDRHVKTGISHARLRPTLAVVDPDLTTSQPPWSLPAQGWTSCATRWRVTPPGRTHRSRPRAPSNGFPTAARIRSQTCGRNEPFHSWPSHFVAAVRNGDDARAGRTWRWRRPWRVWGSATPGHIPHANAYPIAGRVREYRPSGYPHEEPLIPHGMAVALTAPAAFHDLRGLPERHMRAARLLGGSGDGPDLLPTVLRRIMDDVGIPAGLHEVGYTEADIPNLVEGSMAQQRLLALAPGRGGLR